MIRIESKTSANRTTVSIFWSHRLLAEESSETVESAANKAFNTLEKHLRAAAHAIFDAGLVRRQPEKTSEDVDVLQILASVSSDILEEETRQADLLEEETRQADILEEETRQADIRKACQIESELREEIFRLRDENTRLAAKSNEAAVSVTTSSIVDATAELLDVIAMFEARQQPAPKLAQIKRELGTNQRRFFEMYEHALERMWIKRTDYGRLELTEAGRAFQQAGDRPSS